MDEKRNKFRDKIIAILTVICAVCVIIFAILRLLNILEESLHIAFPLLTVILFLQALAHWQKNREVAIFSLCVAVFILVCTVIVLLLK